MFYPVAVLPPVIRPVALALPSSHVFEGMRAVLDTGMVRWDHMAWAFALNAVWMAAAVWIFSPPVPPGAGARRAAEHRRMNAVTGFWLIRHALVEENSRAFLYGTMDVPICETTRVAQADLYRNLAARLPQPARWVVSPASRTVRTAWRNF